MSPFYKEKKGNDEGCSLLARWRGREMLTFLFGTHDPTRVCLYLRPTQQQQRGLLFSPPPSPPSPLQHPPPPIFAPRESWSDCWIFFSLSHLLLLKNIKVIGRKVQGL